MAAAPAAPSPARFRNVRLFIVGHFISFFTTWKAKKIPLQGLRPDEWLFLLDAETATIPGEVICCVCLVEAPTHL
jgi:hypothetical protein